MMNEIANADFDNTERPLPDAWPPDRIGLSPECYFRLSEEARKLYNQIYDYCTYSSDPQYKTLHKFRVKISKLEGRDREYLIEYFNHDPAIKWLGMPCEPWEYYSKPY